MGNWDKNHKGTRETCGKILPRERKKWPKNPISNEGISKSILCTSCLERQFPNVTCSKSILGQQFYWNLIKKYSILQDEYSTKLHILRGYQPWLDSCLNWKKPQWLSSPELEPSAQRIIDNMYNILIVLFIKWVGIFSQTDILYIFVATDLHYLLPPSMTFVVRLH